MTFFNKIKQGEDESAPCSELILGTMRWATVLYVFHAYNREAKVRTMC